MTTVTFDGSSHNFGLHSSPRPLARPCPALPVLFLDSISVLAGHTLEHLCVEQSVVENSGCSMIKRGAVIFYVNF